MERRRWYSGLDPVLPVVIGALQIAGTHFAAQRQDIPLGGPGYALLIIGPLALVFRRRYPVTTMVITLGTALVYYLSGNPYGPVFLSLVAGIFAAVLAGRRRAAWIGAGLGLIVYWLVAALPGGVRPPGIGEISWLLGWLVVALTIAELVRMRRERTAEALHAAEEEKRRQTSEERLRIARELHDVLAHNISLINVQAGVALHLLDSHPEQARPALTAIKQASKDVLSEMRSVLAVLREGAPRAPVAGLADLPALIDTSPLSVKVSTSGVVEQLPPGVDLAAYRIVQEAFTNITRHSEASSATVALTYGPSELEVRVDDPGPATTAPPLPSGGNGIPGMRERATALGGSLSAGPLPGGGYRVIARLPREDL